MTTTATTNGSVQITREERTYRPDTYSYLADLALAHLPDDRPGKHMARERLLRHEHEQQVELRAPTATYADPPRWLIDRFATYPRPDRVLLNLVAAAGNLLPLAQKPGFSSVNTIRLTTGTSTGAQTPGTPVADTDFTEAAVPTGATAGPTNDIRDPTTGTRLALIAGDADVPLGMLEQSGPGQAHLDAVLFKDLTEDYNAKVETQLLTGAGGSGPFAPLLGLLNVSGVNSITYTDAAPTVTKFVQVQSSLTAGGAAPQAVAAIGNRRKRPMQCWMMTSSRAAWFGAATTTVSFANAVSNQTGAGEFDLLAFPVILNDAIPTNCVAGVVTQGGTQDVVIGFRPSDLLVFESAPTMRTYTQTPSGTLEARVQYRCHVGAILGRYPSGISVIGGTGLTVQTALGF